MFARSDLRKLAAVAVLLSLPSGASAGSDLTRSIAAGAQRGAARFEAVYREMGISGVSEAVEACYRSPRSRKGVEALAECAGLDIMGANVDGQAVAGLGVPGYDFFSRAALEKRVAAGMKAAGLSKAERREFDRAIMAYLNGGTGEAGEPAANPPPTAAEVVSLDSLAGLPFDHNGSEMIVDAAKGVIVYAKPKASITGTVRPGTVLVRGEPWSLNPRSAPIRGTAFVFRKGCAPAPYAVRGTYRGEGFVLTGAAPVRAKGSCAVTRASAASGNARLDFESTYMDE